MLWSGLPKEVHGAALGIYRKLCKAGLFQWAFGRYYLFFLHLYCYSFYSILNWLFCLLVHLFRICADDLGCVQFYFIVFMSWVLCMPH